MNHTVLQETAYVELSQHDLGSINGGQVVPPVWWVVLIIGSALANSGDIIDGARDGFNATH